MKLGLYIIAALLVSAFGAHFLLANPGYVLIDFRDYQVEMSVPVLVFFVALLVFAIWLVRRLLIAPRLLGEAAGRYRAGRAGQKLTRGMIEVAEGNFARGEKLLARAAHSSDSPLFNYLQAARAAHLQGKDERRDEWLKLAYEETPGAANAVLLTQAELQLDSKQYEQALATLRRLDENSRNHGYALTLLGRLYFKLEDWQQLGQVLPRIRKFGRVETATLDEWTMRVHCEELEAAPDGDAVIRELASVPKRLNSDPTVLEAYYRALIRTGMSDKAEKDLATAIGKNWRGPLVRLYGIVEGADPSKQLKKAEGWLTKHPEDPDLLLAAARLCLRNKLWGKARSYLESVIGIRPSPEVYQVYGKLLNQLGEADAAAEAFREGLGMVSDEPLPAIPHLAADSDQA
ncbi:MAG: heme biosynthesis HemY N-terminal domain-containing protein [Woeseiaceae bacterium]|nr:heme biosynthesis HemY N-terminal domain-containing protein [Woeseiaceae bacterium]